MLNLDSFKVILSFTSFLYFPTIFVIHYLLKLSLTQFTLALVKPSIKFHISFYYTSYVKLALMASSGVYFKTICTTALIVQSLTTVCLLFYLFLQVFHRVASLVHFYSSSILMTFLLYHSHPTFLCMHMTLNA